MIELINEESAAGDLSTAIKLDVITEETSVIEIIAIGPQGPAGSVVGGGTVTSFSAGDCAPLFTTTEATPTSTPALSFVLSDAAAHSYLGNNTGTSGAPGYHVIDYGELSGAPTIPNAIFKTISVSGQSDVVADSAVDTLTLAAGSNVTITTNAATDTITIAAVGTGTVTTTGSPVSGNLTKFSGASSITNADLTGDVTTSGTVATTIANRAVTYAKIQNVSANSKLLGSSATGSGAPPSEITLGNNLSMIGSTLNASSAGPVTTIKVSGSDFTTASSALVDVTGLTFATATNSFYEVDVLLRIKDPTGNGMAMAVNHSTAGATVSLAVWADKSTSPPFTALINVLATATATISPASASTNAFIYVKGTLVTGANAGNFTVQVKEPVSGTLTVFIGSRMTITQLQ